MFALTKLFAAVASLADNVTALASTVAETNAALRGRLLLDAPADDAPALDHVPDNGHGRRGRKQTA
jgi:hypothetical protein